MLILDGKWSVDKISTQNVFWTSADVINRCICPQPITWAA